ncbi:homeodomain-leucine zipper transcription factor TaHDZipI-1 [Zea mays]|uniref:Homeobox-leucine zipper protein n=1 Tax=Zea mays TaxID=4577 RepID=A0A804R6X1_MAIZE|nr:homeodomain-leucine zipper transcription factor TaHDZipI-1 [Zea mays]
MKRQSKRPTASRDSPETGTVDKQLALAESLTARKTEPDELGEKKRRLAPDQVRALERCFEADNRLDPDRKARVARDLALNPRQVAVWFQNRRARWKAKALHRDFAALRARHDALRRDKDALAAEIRELRQKLAEPAAVKTEATGSDTAEARPTTTTTAGAPAPPAGGCKDGSSDSDSSVVLNDDVDASPYSGAAFEQPGAFAGFGAPFLAASAAAAPPPTGCSSPPVFETKWQHGPTTYAFESYKSCCAGYGFTEEWLASSDVVGSDGAAGFFSEDHASSLNFSWCASGAQDWE